MQRNGYPPHLAKALEHLMHLGFGFQAFGTKEGEIVFARTNCEEPAVYQALQKIAPTCRSIDFLGHNFIGVDYTSYRLIPKLIQTVLDMGFIIGMHIQGCRVTFKSEPFTWALFEQKLADQVNPRLKAGKPGLVGWLYTVSLSLRSPL